MFTPMAGPHSVVHTQNMKQPRIPITKYIITRHAAMAQNWRWSISHSTSNLIIAFRSFFLYAIHKKRDQIHPTVATIIMPSTYQRYGHDDQQRLGKLVALYCIDYRRIETILGTLLYYSTTATVIFVSSFYKTYPLEVTLSYHYWHNSSRQFAGLQTFTHHVLKDQKYILGQSWKSYIYKLQR